MNTRSSGIFAFWLLMILAALAVVYAAAEVLQALARALNELMHALTSSLVFLVVVAFIAGASVFLWRRYRESKQMPVVVESQPQPLPRSQQRIVTAQEILALAAQGEHTVMRQSLQALDEEERRRIQGLLAMVAEMTTNTVTELAQTPTVKRITSRGRREGHGM